MKQITIEEQSKFLKLNKKDMGKILKGCALAGSGAIVAYLLQILPSIDLGVNTYILIPVISSMLNFVLKLIKNK